MLRRVENVRVTHKPGLFSKKGRVTLWIGKEFITPWTKLPQEEFARWLEATRTVPVCFGRTGGRNYWLFQGKWHWDNDGLNRDQIHALLVTRAQRQEATIKRAQSMVAMDLAPIASTRRAIAPDLKQFVWKRDGGRCRQCGHNVELQFDHVIPIAYGGATTAENLQILCGHCNRRKGASVA
jgi:5-methylcytosine-specific restriction endonuclease McrA